MPLCAKWCISYKYGCSTIYNGCAINNDKKFLANYFDVLELKHAHIIDNFKALSDYDDLNLFLLYNRLLIKPSKKSPKKSSLRIELLKSLIKFYLYIV